jgi:hypothetical protein
MERRTAEGYLYGRGLNIQWTGLDKVRANLRTLAERYPEEMGRVLREEGVAIMEESMRICPYDQDNPHNDGTPHLNDTGQVEGPYHENGVSSVVLSFDTPYAAIQHEVQEYHHDFPEQWKYLEHPMNERAKYMPANLIKGVDIERLLREGQGGGYSARSMQGVREDNKNKRLDDARRRAETKVAARNVYLANPKNWVRR